jgi:hypothetical protein
MYFLFSFLPRTKYWSCSIFSLWIQLFVAKHIHVGFACLLDRFSDFHLLLENQDCFMRTEGIHAKL